MSLSAHEVTRGASRPRDTLRFARDSLARAARRQSLAVITVPAPAQPFAAQFGVDTGAAVLWAPPSGPSMVGRGAAAEVMASGPDRLRGLAQASLPLWECLEVATHPDAPELPPRLFGGVAFTAGAADEAPWEQFGDARFVLPQWTWGQDERGAWLTLAIDTLFPTSFDPLAELERLLHAPPPLAPPLPTIRSIAAPDRARWQRDIESIRAAIAAGACSKIVAARATAIGFQRPACLGAVAVAMEREYADCYRFGVQFRTDAFVGATPERLVRRCGDEVVTEALAGSIAAGDGAGERLLGSAKDRGEQQLVVDAIVAALAPLCRTLEVPTEPEIRRLRHVLHLHTPIRGVLRDRPHVLELAARLHPTPAVGGVPTAAALEWIAAHEHERRGWYAAPIGWFDANGDGELVVAIRSGLFGGTKAHLYAGAGIVAGSDADAELEETQLKQRALLSLFDHVEARQ